MGKKKKKRESGSTWLPFPDTECVDAVMRVFTDLYCLEQPENRIKTKKRREREKRIQVMQVKVIDDLF